MSELRHIAIEALVPGRGQPRTTFDEATLYELAASIKAQGLIEPIIVRRIAHNTFEIIAGERRYRAAIHAGFKEVPCIVRQYTDEQARLCALIENIQRESLNVIEQANAFVQLQKKHQYDHTEIGKLIGKSRSYVANIVRLLKLAIPVQKALEKGQVSMGQVKVLIGLTPILQVNLIEKIIRHQWSSRKIESYVKALKSRPHINTKNPDISALEALISEHTATPVSIESQGVQGGWLKLKYYDNQTLTGLLKKLGITLEE